MHTRTFVIDRTADGKEHRVTMHYNSDLSGSVHVITTNKQGESKEVHVPGYVLVDFIAGHVADRHVEVLEQRPRAALGIPDDWPPRWGNEGRRR